MPEKLERCVQHLVGKGYPESSAWPICRTSLGMAKDGETDEEYLARALETAKREGSKMALETADLDGVEIFAVGAWNGKKFTEKDLDLMVKAFEETKGLLRPFVKIGHGENQSLLRNDELPAAGWVDNVRRVGGKLLADFKRVPAKIRDLIASGAYRTRSVELYKDISLGGKLYKWAVKAVALLGADMPAVTSLDDIVALYGAEFDAAIAFKANSEATTYFAADKEDMMDPKELEKKYSEAQARVIELETELKVVKEQDVEKLRSEFKASEAKAGKLTLDLEKSEKAKTEAEDKLAKFTREAKEKEIHAKVTGLIEKGKLAPAQKDVAIGLLMGSDKIKVADKELRQEEAIFSLIENGLGVNLQTDENTTAGNANRAGEQGREALHKAAENYSREHKVSYKDALLEVSRNGK